MVTLYIPYSHRRGLDPLLLLIDHKQTSCACHRLIVVKQQAKQITGGHDYNRIAHNRLLIDTWMVVRGGEEGWADHFLSAKKRQHLTLNNASRSLFQSLRVAWFNLTLIECMRDIKFACLWLASVVGHDGQSLNCVCENAKELKHRPNYHHYHFIAPPT